MTRQRPEYWDRLGSSKTRSEEQKEESRQVITEMVDGADPSTVVAFTDGSCLPNPGPCGAGASIYLPYQKDPVQLSKPVSNCGSILLGELVAILTILQFIKEEVPSTNQ